jgi:ribonuclease P protein component
LVRIHPLWGAFEEAMREEDVSAEQPEAEKEARIPPSDAYARGTGGAAASSVQGPDAPLRLIWRIRDRASFRALARARRRRRGALTVTSVPTGFLSDPPRVAFAVDRRVGTAVARNRVRRQLRMAVRANADLLRPGHAYLVGASSASRQTPFRDLESTLRATLAEEADRG